MKQSGIFERILLINIILILSLGAMFFATETSWTHDGVIEHGDHLYTLNETGTSRVIGAAKDAPDYKVTVLTSMIQPVRKVGSEALENGVKVYELSLDPGIYILAVDAEGYETLDIKDIEVRPGHDLRLDLKFSKKQT
jgi:hypothetical protein